MNEDFCSSINKSAFAKVADLFYTQRDCRKKLSVRTPDILLLGLDLPDGYWVDFCTEIRKKYPAIKVLAITSYDEYTVFKNSLNSLTSGYISKDALPKVIVSAIHAVMEGNFFRYDKIVVPAEKDEPEPEWLKNVVRQMIGKIQNDDSHRETIEKLSMVIQATEKVRRTMIQNLITNEKYDTDDNWTDRYLKQLIENMLIKGSPNWEIAEVLNVSIETVRLYRMEFIRQLSGQNTMILAVRDGETIRLGRREQQLLRLIAAGYTNQEIADDILYVDIETVKTLRKNLILKFETKNTMTMVISALRKGLLNLEEIDDLLS